MSNSFSGPVFPVGRQPRVVGVALREARDLRAAAGRARNPERIASLTRDAALAEERAEAERVRSANRIVRARAEQRERSQGRVKVGA